MKELRPSAPPFHGFIPTVSTVQVDQITLLIMFGNSDNYWTKQLCFEVVDLEASYHIILGRPRNVKFMVVPHYVYVLLKIPGPTGVLTICGDAKRAYDCEQ